MTFGQKIDRVFNTLDPEQPFYTPNDVCDILGIKRNGFTYHCRSVMPGHTGDYRFYRANPTQMAQLREIVSRILMTGRKLPKHLK